MFEVGESGCQKCNLERYNVNSPTIPVGLHIKYFNPYFSNGDFATTSSSMLHAYSNLQSKIRIPKLAF
jgi:hypothetical protein